MRTDLPPPASVPSVPSGVSRVRRVPALLAGVVLLLPAVLAHPGQHGAALLVAAMAAMVTATALLPWPVGRIGLAAGAGSMAGLSLLLDVGYSGPYRLPAFWLLFEWLALVGVLFRVVRRVPGRWVGVVGAAVGCAASLLPLRFTLRMPHGSWSGSLIGVLLALLPALGVAGAALYLRVLDSRRERAVDRARREQRLEVARGLHDFVAHEITGIVLEAQAGQLGPQDGQETALLLRRLEEAGLRALDSMDEMVGALRDPQSGETVREARRYGPADLPELVARFDAAGGMRATVHLPPDPGALLSAEAGATAYAVVLEALTNVRRHAPGADAVVVRVTAVVGAGVEISVTNSGGGSAARRGRRLLRRRLGAGGTGLAGLAARVAAHGGALAAGPHEPGGWRVVCTLPGR
ncbi:histidine kinase [Streptomyces sp. SP17BM10]|uniref:sensor histidine kinase n=1 Tax=Streptomyces sp. SP17BM10 TaxID=3002530 RepID=UPI002E766F80|nr:ATP-binding protein [Streptomyces sp. SP17BM10]MEE1782021.1 histidine kinase [Streptomyces sp. SP17BM10]